MNSHEHSQVLFRGICHRRDWLEKEQDRRCCDTCVQNLCQNCSLFTNPSCNLWHVSLSCQTLFKSIMNLPPPVCICSLQRNQIKMELQFITRNTNPHTSIQLCLGSKSVSQGRSWMLHTCVILPDAQTWLSFSITIPLRSCLCMDAPPTSMAYFSTRRKPGVVLRVPATSPCQPPAVAIACSWEQRVAIPEALARQLRAGLSPRRRHLAGPLTTAVSVTASGPVEAIRLMKGQSHHSNNNAK